jgi:hypothetical protein
MAAINEDEEPEFLLLVAKTEVVEEYVFYALRIV